MEFESLSYSNDIGASGFFENLPSIIYYPDLPLFPSLFGVYESCYSVFEL